MTSLWEFTDLFMREVIISIKGISKVVYRGYGLIEHFKVSYYYVNDRVQ